MNIDVSRGRCAAGPRCDHNEDVIVVRVDGLRVLLAVFDGMGGTPCGEVAAELAGSTLLDALARHGALGSPDPETLLDACVRIQDALATESARRALPERMGTVGTIAWLERADDVLKGHIAHVGDTRALIVAPDGTGGQLTRDHGVVAMDEVPEADSLSVPHRNLVTRFFGWEEMDGGRARERVDLLPVCLTVGTFLVLCSDGVSDFMDRPHLMAHGRAPGLDATRYADAIFEAAEAAQRDPVFPKGDNISVVVARLAPDAQAIAPAVPEPPSAPVVDTVRTRGFGVRILPIAAFFTFFTASVCCGVTTAAVSLARTWFRGAQVPVADPRGRPLGAVAQSACDERPAADAVCVVTLARHETPLDLSGPWSDANVEGSGASWTIDADRPPMVVDAGAHVELRDIRLHSSGSGRLVFALGDDAELTLADVVWEDPTASVELGLCPGARLRIAAGTSMRAQRFTARRRIEGCTTTDEAVAEPGYLVFDGGRLRVAEGSLLAGASGEVVVSVGPDSTLDLGRARLLEEPEEPKMLSRVFGDAPIARGDGAPTFVLPTGSPLSPWLAARGARVLEERDDAPAH